MNTGKKCLNHCPKCGANDTDIEWGSTTWDTNPSQDAVCLECGCEFTEFYTYSFTVEAQAGF